MFFPSLPFPVTTALFEAITVCISIWCYLIIHELRFVLQTKLDSFLIFYLQAFKNALTVIKTHVEYFVFIIFLQQLFTHFSKIFKEIGNGFNSFVIIF
jgi:hypothetical protein